MPIKIGRNNKTIFFPRILREIRLWSDIMMKSSGIDISRFYQLIQNPSQNHETNTSYQIFRWIERRSATFLVTSDKLRIKPSSELKVKLGGQQEFDETVLWSKFRFKGSGTKWGEMNRHFRNVFQSLELCKVWVGVVIVMTTRHRRFFYKSFKGGGGLSSGVWDTRGSDTRRKGLNWSILQLRATAFIAGLCKPCRL